MDSLILVSCFYSGGTAKALKIFPDLPKPYWNQARFWSDGTCIRKMVAHSVRRAMHAPWRANLCRFCRAAAHPVALDYVQRLAFLDFGPADAASLKAFGCAIDGSTSDFVDDFYEHLHRFPDTRQLLSDPGVVVRLKNAQRTYFNQMLAGKYDADYADNRARVGVVHHRVGLEPKWYLGAYTLYLRSLLPIVWRTAGAQWEQAQPLLESLLKIVFYDLGIALDTYRATDKRHVVSLQRFNEGIVENMPSGLLVLDRNLRIIRANRTFLAQWQLPYDAILGLTAPDVLNFPQFDSRLRDVLKTGSGFSGLRLCSAQDRSGVARCLRCAAVRVVSQSEIEDADDVRLLVMFEDVTAEEEATSRLKALLDAAPDAVSYLDREGRVHFSNRRESALPEERRTGRAWQDFVVPESHDAVSAALASVYATRNTVTLEVTMRNPDGSRRIFSCRLGPAMGHDEVVGVVVVARDITETRKAEIQFESAARMASVGTLAAGIAHEINTPIQFVGDSVHFMRDAVTDLFGVLEKYRQALATAAPETRAALEEQFSRIDEESDLGYLCEQVPRALERSLEGLGRVSDIVRAMKAFAHPNQDEMALVQINDLIRTTTVVARNEYKYVADLHVELGAVPQVRGYAGEINQALLNIIVNAAHAIGDVVKGTENRGRLTLRTQVDDGMLVVSISDTGNGIPEAARDRVFDMFFTTKEVGKGTGQGLALARATMEKHMGSIAFETASGQGTTFFLRFPLDNSQAQGVGQ